ncbi:CPBP family intramembrane glutamic endopeptidase [Inconstantimicrobium porci]|uniref:CPBP family intramembrane metalloprotease n=1 Tax=Inconstantimicrobium porci TaxID=2652291 RepID=A0A7X2MYT5_9CLOT|nr:type II CAAX endopeptidase family protein [Inconstantimicrobium porci]MDD6771709.1 type II CAAX endopeptidase family protein [Inconstantimicrobium porci]MSR91584.1 CPBP family intramembrane metalloprotease [Inconstantimicrobium porci]
MKLINNLRKNHSIVFCVLFAFVYMVLFNLVGLAVAFLKLDSMMSQSLVELICIGFAVFIMYKLKMKNFLKEKGTGFFKGLFTGMFLLCLSLYVFAIGLIMSVFSDKIGITEIFNILIMSVSVGLCEEFVFRGIVVNILKEKYGDSKKEIYITVFTAGIIFGLIHLTNILAGASFQGTIVQVICVMALGSYLAAVYVRCRNIWSMAFLHGLNDFAAFLVAGASTMQSVTGSISSYGLIKLITIPIYLIPTFILLRESKITKIIGNQDK